MPGFTHLQTAQPVTFGHHMLAWFEMAHRDRERIRECRARLKRVAARSGSACRNHFPHRPCRHRERARLRRHRPELARCGERPRFRHRVLRLRRHRGHAPVALVRGDGDLDLAAVRFRGTAGCVLHRIQHHAAEEEPRRARTGAWQDRAHRRQPDEPSGVDEGSAPCLQQGQPGGQGTALRHRRYAGGLPACHRRYRGCNAAPIPRACARLRNSGSPPPRIWRTTS